MQTESSGAERLTMTRWALTTACNAPHSQSAVQFQNTNLGSAELQKPEIPEPWEDKGCQSLFSRRADCKWALEFEGLKTRPSLHFLLPLEVPQGSSLMFWQRLAPLQITAALQLSEQVLWSRQGLLETAVTVMASKMFAVVSPFQVDSPFHSSLPDFCVLSLCSLAIYAHFSLPARLLPLQFFSLLQIFVHVWLGQFLLQRRHLS